MLQVHHRYAAAEQRCEEIVLRLEKSHADHMVYREALTHAEKWLMNTSFNLMTFNARDLDTPEVTSQQAQELEVCAMVVYRKFTY